MNPSKLHQSGGVDTGESEEIKGVSKNMKPLTERSSLEQFRYQLKQEKSTLSGEPIVCVIGSRDYDALIGECRALFHNYLSMPEDKCRATMVFGVMCYRCNARHYGFYFGGLDV